MRLVCTYRHEAEPGRDDGRGVGNEWFSAKRRQMVPKVLRSSWGLSRRTSATDGSGKPWVPVGVYIWTPPDQEKIMTDSHIDSRQSGSWNTVPYYKGTETLGWDLRRLGLGFITATQSHGDLLRGSCLKCSHGHSPSTSSANFLHYHHDLAACIHAPGWNRLSKFVF